MSVRAHTPLLLRRHPPSSALSEYLDGELALPDRVQLERHLRHCARCTRNLESLTQTITLLAGLRDERKTDVAESVITALRDEQVSPDPGLTRTAPALTAVGKAPHVATRGSGSDRRLSGLESLARYCLARSQLRLVIPVAVVVGVVLSLTDQGAMLLHRQLDVASCVALNLVAPFIVLNALLLLTRRILGQRPAPLHRN